MTAPFQKPVGKDICVVAYAWFPNNQVLWEALQPRVRYAIKQFVVSETDPHRTWTIPENLTVKPIVVPGHHVSFMSRYISVNPSFPRYLAHTDPCVLVVNGWSDPSHLWVRRAARRHRVPLITWMSGRDHAISRSTSDRAIRTLSNLLARRLIRNSRFVFAYGSIARDEAIALGADPDRVAIVKQTIDERHFDYKSHVLTSEERRALRAEIGADERPLFLCISQLVPRKGIIDLLQAMRMLRAQAIDAQLLLIGMGPLEPVVRESVEEFCARLIWLRSVPYEEIARYYALADYFVFPTHFDTWGNVINESHCARLPVITSDGAHAVVDLVEHRRTGLIYRAGRVRDLADLMRYAIAHPGEMREGASRGYEFIQSRWNVEESAKIWAEYLHKAVGYLSPVM